MIDLTAYHGLLSLAISGETSDPWVWPLVMGMAGGLALFLFGMDQMAEALKAVAGERMKVILARLTGNRLMAAMTGAFVTAVIQSSSVTTVMVVGFITAGLMNFTQSIGVIMGANVGTTLTAQLIAFKVTRYSLLIIAVGFGLRFLAGRERLRLYGSAVMGLGLIFFGMSVMGEAMAPLRSFDPFVEQMLRLEDPLVGILVGAVFTALIQASAATTGIVIVLASQGFITLPAGIAVIFGANVGTCVTAFLAALGKPREAVRAAVAHVLFNVAGVLIWLPFIDQLAALVTWLSPTADLLDGTAKLATESPRQIANAHTVFNLSNTLLLLPFTNQIAWLVKKLVPERPEDSSALVRAKYLDEELLDTPSLALDRARLEILHLGDLVIEMLERILPAMLVGSREDLETVRALDDRVDRLYGQIVTYLGKISQHPLTKVQMRDFLHLMEATNDLENIGDVIETNLVILGNSRILEGVTISGSTREVISGFHRVVSKSLAAALQAITQKNDTAADQVIAMKQEINRLADSAAVHQARRLVAQEPKRIPAYSIEMDIIQNLKRIFYFAKRMARAVRPSALTEEADEAVVSGSS